MKTILLITLIVTTILADPILTSRFSTKAKLRADKLNVHLVPHTHDDVGWLKTVDEYYMGLKNYIWPTGAGVQYILDSVIVALDENPDRKFIYVEIAFFARWWKQQTTQKQQLVRKLVKNRQLEFINGGWCMNDEATPYFVDMVDQQTLGHQWLVREFGSDAIPEAGWQIDPFGHSSTQAVLYSLMGMNSWYFGRIDYQDRAHREAAKTTELVMKPSPSLGNSVDIFTGVMRGYNPPSGFLWETGFPAAPFQDDPDLNEYNVKQRVEDFVQAAQAQAKAYPSNHIMFSMGSDFCYSNANTWFKNMDKLIHYVNQDGRVNALYSTPSIYTDALHNDTNWKWTTKTDDWFPYADSIHSYWTGYFTSRPALKGYVRKSSNYLQQCRQLELQLSNLVERLAYINHTLDRQRHNTTVRMRSSSGPSSQRLWEAMSVAQHHDAVSGTEKQTVAYDYAQRISEGNAECEQLIGQALSTLLGSKGTSNLAAELDFRECPLLNQSSCPVTFNAASANFSVAIVLYNTLSFTRQEYIRFPIGNASSPIIISPTGSSVQSVLSTEWWFDPDSSQTFLTFQASVPPMGYATYIYVPNGSVDVDTSSQEGATQPLTNSKESNQKQTVTTDTILDNPYLRLSISNVSGRLVSIHNKKDNLTLSVNQYWGYYQSSVGWTKEAPLQASGAYIFRPNCSEDTLVACDPIQVNSSAQIEVTHTSNVLFSEVVQKFSDWITQRIRLYHDQDNFEVHFTVGPVPVHQDLIGKEVVMRWETDIASNQTFYTDSNGREMQQRKINFRRTWKLNITDPVSMNYYPVSSAIFLQDPLRRLSILTDRSQGGASLADGEIELMVHRRILHDDFRGVGEPLNEPGTNGKVK